MRILLRSLHWKSFLKSGSKHLRVQGVQMKTQSTMEKEQKPSGEDVSQTNVEDGVSTEFNLVTEGKATILQPKTVFYNPVQEFNRDITIAFISEFAEEQVKERREKQKKEKLKEKEKLGEAMDTDQDESDESFLLEAGKHCSDGVRILEGLAASGLRSMRFALEVPGVNKIVCNDFDKTAVQVIEKNIKRNGVSHLVESSLGDASMIMYQNKGFKDRFDVVDLDPYGTAAPFLDAGVQAVRDGGLLCVTSTDAAVLCGNTPEKCFALYGSTSVKTSSCHEMALRIILHCIESHAARHSRYIVPMASFSVDFYFRLFVKVYTGPYKAKFAASHSGMVYYCPGCGVSTTQTLCDAVPAKGDMMKFVRSKGPPVLERCEHCNSRHEISGPVYLGKLHDKKYVDRVLNRVVADQKKFGAAKRIEGMLAMAGEELEVPLYLELDALNLVLHCVPPKMDDIRSALLNAGYKVSFSHACRNSVKTDAPNNVIWDIMRAHVEKSGVVSKKNTEGTPGFNILKKKPSIEVNFDPHPDAQPLSKKQGLVRFPEAPQKNWGPLPRAKRGCDGDSMEEKRLKNQGKRKRKAEEATEENQ